MFSALRQAAAAGAATLLMAVLPSGAMSAVTFAGSFSLDGSAFSDPGLVVNADPMSGPVSFDLDLGQSASFDLFDLWTNESYVNPDDTAPQNIEVSFSFTSPVTAGALGGTTTGLSFFGIYQAGEVVWDNPLSLSFGPAGDGLLLISLTDATFNAGYFGLDRGVRDGATIGATVSYVRAPSPVPLPASALLLLGAVGGFAWLSGKQRRAA